MLEITHPEDGAFSIQTLGRLWVVCLDVFQLLPYPVIDLDKVILSIPNVTLVWDVCRKEISWWACPRNLPRIEAVSEPSELASFVGTTCSPFFRLF